MRKPTRAAGFYWVRRGQEPWCVGRYAEGWWTCCGTAEVRDEAQMQREGWKVARRIKEPSAR